MDLGVNRRHCGGESVTSLPEGFRKEGVILSLILFRCAKRSILPDKTTLLENELARLQSEFHSTKSQNSSLVVCIPSSRQLKKYKIFVLPGWISGNIFMPPIVAFHEIPLVLRLQVLSVAGRLYSNLYIL